MTSADDYRVIHALLLDYCDAADRADVASILRCFAADAAVDYGPRLRARGRTALTALFDRFIDANQATSHHLTNFRIDREQDGLIACTSYVRAWHLLTTGERLVIMGRYVDHVRRTSGGWRLARRRLEVHGANGPAPGFHRLDRTPT